MGAKNFTGIRRVKRGGKLRLIIDFRYTDTNGERVRFRRAASVQAREAAMAEAQRLMKNAAETGTPETAAPAAAVVKPVQLRFREFVDGAFARLFMPRYRPSTRERYEALLRQSVRCFFGEMKLVAIDAAALRGYAAMLSAKNVQVKGGVNLVRTVLRAALESGELERLPELPRLVKASRKLPDTFTDDELVIVPAQASGWLATAIQLSAQAGLRMGEVLALLVGDIDFDQENLLVRRALSGGEVLTPKSGDQRVVPLTPGLSAYLHTQVDGQAHDARVVLDESGNTPRRQEVLRTFKRLLRKLGLKERSFHSLRHAFLSKLVRRGASVEAVRMLAGHSSLTVTERYVHATAGDLRRAIGLLH